MICKCCREDLPKESFDPFVYEQCRRTLQILYCVTCGALPKQVRSAKTAAWMAAHPKPRKAKKERLSKQQRKTETRHQKQLARDEAWRQLTPTEKRASLIKSRTLYEKQLEAELIHQRIEHDIQVPVGAYFLDFHIKPLLLAVEIDGGYHTTDGQIAKDNARTQVLQRLGWSVIRFSNEQVKKDMPAVIAGIRGQLPSKRKLKKMTQEVHTGFDYTGDVSFDPTTFEEATGMSTRAMSARA